MYVCVCVFQLHRHFSPLSEETHLPWGAHALTAEAARVTVGDVGPRHACLTHPTPSYPSCLSNLAHHAPSSLPYPTCTSSSVAGRSAAVYGSTHSHPPLARAVSRSDLGACMGRTTCESGIKQCEHGHMSSGSGMEHPEGEAGGADWIHQVPELTPMCQCRSPHTN